MTPIDPEHTWGHTVPFGEAYYREARTLLSALRDDASILAEIAGVATDALRTGHTVYANVTTGHMPTYELVNEREGNPALFAFTGDDVCTPEQFAALRAGDVLLTNHVGEQERDARDAGVCVVVFTTCYVNNRNTPPGKVNPNIHGWMPEDVATRVIYTPIPWEQGLVRVPEIPHMKVFPGSAVGSCAVHWMITAEVAHALATDTPPSGAVGRRYVETLLERLDAIYAGEMASIQRLAVTLAKRIIGGGRLYVRSRNKGVESETHGVAQGLMLCNAFEPRSAQEGGDRDLLLIAAVVRDDPQEIAWADEARTRGNYIVGIGPETNPGLRERCDVYLSDRCDEPGGVIPIPGRPDPVCPATGVLNNVLTQMLLAQFVDEMCRRGAVPYFYMGGYRVGGSDYNRVIGPYMMERGY